MKGLPPKFYALMKFQEAEILSKIESYIDSEFDILMNRQIFEYFSKKSSKLLHYNKSHEIISSISPQTIILNKNAEPIDSDLLEHLSSILKRDCFSINDIYHIDSNFYFSPADIERMSEDLYRSKEFIDFMNDNKIQLNYGADLMTLLHHISNDEQSKNMIDRLVNRATVNYKLSVLEALSDAIFNNDLKFFLSEAYSVSRLYTPIDLDTHLTQDIPELPYSGEITELKRAYGLKRRIEDINKMELDITEFLFITKYDYFSVQINETYSSVSGDGLYIKTTSHKEGDMIEIFGSELCLTQGELTLLEIEHYADTGLKVTSDFKVNETKLREVIGSNNIEGIKCYQHTKMVMDYHTMHKNAWTNTKHFRITTFKPSFKGLKQRRRTYDDENVTLMFYRRWKSGETVRTLPSNILKLIERRKSKEVESQRDDKRKRAYFLLIPVAMLATAIASTLIHFG